MIYVEIALCSSVIAYVYAEVLMEDGKILFPFWKWLNSVRSYATENNIFIYERLSYMLMCSLCMSGQIALWTFVLTQQFNIMPLVFTVSLSILTTKFISRWS